MPSHYQDITWNYQILGAPGILEPFRTMQKGDGDNSGGENSLFLLFNPDTLTNLNLYVCVTSLVVGWSNATQATAGLQGQSGEFFFDGGTSTMWRSGLSTDDNLLAMQVLELVEPSCPLYLGQVTPGTQGRLKVRIDQNTDGSKYWAMWKGYTSRQYDFLVPTNVAL